MFSRMQKRIFVEENNIGGCIFKGRELVKLIVSQIKVFRPPASVSSIKWVKMQIHEPNPQINQNFWGKG